MFTRKFWRDAIERAVKTAAQAGILVIGADQANLLSMDWRAFVGFCGGGALLSVLTSLGSTMTGDPSSASAVR